jgi:uncharacterized protein (DUF58 family)
MQLHPTRNAVDLTLVGLLLLVLGAAIGKPAILAWGGAIVVGLQIARAVTLLSVARVRGAGFEMLWSEPERAARAAVGQAIELEAEVRNRDSRAARYVELRAVHSPVLEVILEPAFGEVPAGGRLAVTVTMKSERVGRHGVFGLSLEVQGSPGLYEVPLTFSNPFGVEVMPRAYGALSKQSRGGRSSQRAETGLAGKRRGGHDELRELRDYASGDPWKRIAWRASARRGKLMIKEYELEERDIVWVLVDASVELWAGTPGQAPLDHAIDQAARLVEQHGGHGDRVGLGIVASRKLAWIAPNRGKAHLAELLEALAFRTSTNTPDRSGLDEADVAARVLEHLRPLEPQLAENLRVGEVDRIARRAALALKRAPFRCPPPRATTPREQSLWHYLESFGISSPPRLEPERPATRRVLAQALSDVLAQRPKPSLVYVCAPVPELEDQPDFSKKLSGARARVHVRWIPVPREAGIATDDGVTGSAVRYAIELRARTARTDGERWLGTQGVEVEHPRVPRRAVAARELETALLASSEPG